MEHVMVELAPGRQRSTPAAVEPQRDGYRSLWRSRRSRRVASTGQPPVRHSREAMRLRADMRAFDAALARWAR